MSKNKILEINFKTNNGGDLIFYSEDEIVSWIKNELAFWENLLTQDTKQIIGTRFLPSFQRYFKHLRNSLNTYANSNKIDINQIKDGLDMHSRDDLFHSISIKAIAIRTIYLEDGWVSAEAAMLAAGKLHSQGTPTPLQILAISKYLLLTEGFHTSNAQATFDQIERNRVALEDIIRHGHREINELTHKRKATQEEYKKLTSVIKRWGSSRWNAYKKDKSLQIREEIESLQAVKRSFTEHMNLQASVEYWTEKAEEHKRKSEKIRNILIGFALISTGLICLATYKLWPYMMSDQPNNFLWITLFLFISTVTFWAGRILVRLFLSETHLKMDAEERAIMVKTYLALIKENQIQKDDRELLLSALFRPTKNGIIKDDAAPIFTPASYISGRQ